MALYALGEYEDALDSYNKSVAADPSNADVWNNKGITLLAMGNYEMALESYNKSLEINS